MPAAPVPRRGGAHRRRRPAGWSAPAVALVAVLSLVGGTLGGWLYARDHATPAPVALPSTTFSGATVDVAAVLARVEPSVASVRATIMTDGAVVSNVTEAAGTGIVLTADGELLTNAHLVVAASRIEVEVPGSKRTYAAEVLRLNSAADVALVKIRGVSNLTPAPLGDSTRLQVGDDVIAIGNALDLAGGLTVTKGILSGVDRSIVTETGSLGGMLQTDAGISSGNSGGPLVNAAGLVVGMNTAVATSSDTIEAHDIAFAIPISTALTAVGLHRGA